MQHTFFLLFKVFVGLTAVAIQLHVNLPTFLLQLGIGPKSVSIRLARMSPRSRPTKVDTENIDQRPPADAHAATDEGRPDNSRTTPSPSASSPTGAHIEFMNIARDGTSVLAGRATPGSRVTVFENDIPVGTATAGADGDWSLATEHRFASTYLPGSLRAVMAAADEPAVGSVHGARDPSSTTDAEARPVSGPAAHLINQFEQAVAAARQRTQPHGSVPDPSLSTDSPTRNIARAEASPADVLLEGPAEPVSIPIPMQFVYRETTLTDEGTKAVSLLLEYLRLKRFNAITLSGHTDERGSEEYNIDLSRRRLEAAVDLLRKGGYKGAVKLLPKGKTEPYVKVDRSLYDREDLMQLDRRVELMVAR